MVYTAVDTCSTAASSECYLGDLEYRLTFAMYGGLHRNSYMETMKRLNWRRRRVGVVFSQVCHLRMSIRLGRLVGVDLRE